MRHEVFNFFHHIWDVEMAKNIVRNYEVSEVEIKQIPFWRTIVIDKDYALTTDLNNPIILAHSFDNDGNSIGVLMIDGHHRCYKAEKEGIEKLLLTFYLKRIVKLFGKNKL